LHYLRGTMTFWTLCNYIPCRKHRVLHPKRCIDAYFRCVTSFDCEHLSAQRCFIYEGNNYMSFDMGTKLVMPCNLYATSKWLKSYLVHWQTMLLKSLAKIMLPTNYPIQTFKFYFIWIFFTIYFICDYENVTITINTSRKICKFHTTIL